MQVSISKFLGINRQPAADYRPGMLFEAYNVEIAPFGPVRRRPALRYRATAPSASAGLYGVGDRVHVAAPVGTDITGLAPTLAVDLLSIGNGATFVDVHGTIANSIGQTFALVETDTGANETHQAETPDVAPAGSTLVSLPFTPIPAKLAKIAGRAYMLDGGSGARLERFSALDDPSGATNITEWDPAADPDNAAARGGFLDIGQHYGGGGAAVGQVEFNGRLAVFFKGAIQVWRFGGDPENDAYIEKVITGPGLRHAQAVAQVGQDAYFLSPDLSVQSLDRATMTEGAEDQSIGTPIESLLQSTWSEVITPRAIHARSRGQFLLAFGQDVFCLAYIPGQGRLGWTRWRLPVPVDAWAEVGTELWMRSGDLVYSFDETMAQDETADDVFADIPVRVETQDLVRGPGWKNVRRVAATCTEQVNLQVVRDGRPALAGDGSLPAGIGTRVTLAPRAPEPTQAMGAWACRTMRARIHDDAAGPDWRLDGLFFDIDEHRHFGVR